MNPWVLGSHFKSVFAFLGWHVVSSVVCLLFAFLGWHVVCSVVCCCLELIVYYCPSKKMIESEFQGDSMERNLLNSVWVQSF